MCLPAAELGDVPHAELLLVVQLHLAAQLLLLAALGLAVRGNLMGYQVENIFNNPFLMVMKLFPMLSTTHLGESVTQTQRLKIRYFWNFIFCHLNIVRV